MVLSTGQHNFIFGINISCYCSDMFRLYDHFRPTKLQKCNVLKKTSNYISNGLRFQPYSFLEQNIVFIFLLYTHTVVTVYMFIMIDNFFLKIDLFAVLCEVCDALNEAAGCAVLLIFRG
jgi:hypothetical protein